jgi:hypothetical protein
VGSAIRQMQLHTCEIEIDEQPCSRETYFQSVYTTLKSVGQRLAYVLSNSSQNGGTICDSRSLIVAHTGGERFWESSWLFLVWASRPLRKLVYGWGGAAAWCWANRSKVLGWARRAHSRSTRPTRDCLFDIERPRRTRGAGRTTESGRRSRLAGQNLFVDRKDQVHAGADPARIAGRSNALELIDPGPRGTRGLSPRCKRRGVGNFRGCAGTRDCLRISV